MKYHIHKVGLIPPLYRPLVAQMVKNLPAVQDIWVLSLGWEGNGYPL